MPRALGFCAALLLCAGLVQKTNADQVPAPSLYSNLPVPAPVAAEEQAAPSGPPGPPAPPSPVRPPPAFGGDAGAGFAALLSPTLGNIPTRASYQTRWLPEADVSGQPTELGFLRHDLAVLAPLYQDDCREATLTAGARALLFQGSAVLPDSGQPFPADLWDLRVGGAYRQRLANDWIVGGTVSVGSASDRPFYSFEETLWNVAAFARAPSGESDAWLFSLFYSSVSELRFPMPGVAYQWAPSERLLAVVGVPFAVIARPTDELTLSLFYLPVRNVQARAVYAVAPPVRLYAAYEWANESYFLVGRAEERDRLFYYEMRLTAGVQLPLSRQLAVEVFGGYSFERFFFEGRGFEDSDTNRLDLGDAPFVGAQATVRW